MSYPSESIERDKRVDHFVHPRVVGLAMVMETGDARGDARVAAKQQRTERHADKAMRKLHVGLKSELSDKEENGRL